MVAGCGSSCVKYIFFTFNFLVFVCGGAVLGVALWARFDDNFQYAINLALKDGAKYPLEIQNVHIVLYIIAAIGGLLLLCGFLGCCGACCESTALLGLFFTLVLLLFLAEVAGAIYIFVRKDTIKTELKEWYKASLINHYNTNEDIRKLLDETQERLQCCGASGCGDYPLPLPASCHCDAGFRPGCFDKVFDQLKTHLTVVAVVAASLVVIELLAMIFACILCSAIRRSDVF